MTERAYRENIGMREFPPFLRVTLEDNAREELFSCAENKLGKIKREYKTFEDVFNILYGEKNARILHLLSESPQTAKDLAKRSGMNASAVYHFLNSLGKKHVVSRRNHVFYLEDDFNSLFLDEIVRLDENPSSRRRYGISTKELELAYVLWDKIVEISPQERRYARTYQSKYTLADAVHRWKTGRTDVPVWALVQLVEFSGSDVLGRRGVVQYHLPPGLPVKPYYNGEYNLPIRVDADLDKILIQLLQKLSKNSTYTFPKRKKWLFETLHSKFGDFDDSTSRIPSAIVEILKHYYGLKTLRRSSACVPLRMKARWESLTPMSRVMEESSFLLHIVSLSSQFKGGFEVTSLSRRLLEDVSALLENLGLGTLTVHKKHQRSHFRVYLSESRVEALRRYTHLFQEYPDLEIWLRIPMNQVGEKLTQTEIDPVSVESVCYEELSRFVESILRSSERKKSLYEKKNHMQYKEEVTDYFWERRSIPSPRKVEEIVEMRVIEEESLLYA